MAEMESRFAHVNSAGLDATAITGSSERSDHAARQVGNPARGALWITPVGHNVVAGFNDAVLFEEDASGNSFYRLGRIAAGNYQTVDAYAAAIGVAMNGAAMYPGLHPAAALWLRLSHQRRTYGDVATGEAITLLQSWATLLTDMQLTATAPAAPTFDATIAGGEGAASFDGTNDRMQSDNTLASIITSGGSGHRHTAFVVCRSDAAGGANQYIFANGTSGDYGLFYREAGSAFRFSANDGAVKTVDKAATQGAFHIVTVMKDATNIYIGVDDTRTASLASTACGALAHPAETLVFGDAAGANRLTGYIAEIVWFSEALTEDERARVEAYLAAKYGITVGSSAAWANTYAGTYDADTELISIARTSGAEAWSLQPIDIEAAPEKIYQEAFNGDAGFIKEGTGYASGASITAERAARHSREYVDLDLGPASCRVVIIAGVNDKIPFKFDGSSALEATIGPGIYETPDDVAQAVEDARVPGVGTFGSTWTVTWNPANNKLSARFDGGVGGELLFASGSSVLNGTSAHATLGWASVDVSVAPAASATADNELWGWNPTALVVALDHNAGGAGVFRALLNDQPNASAYARGPNAIELTLIGDEVQRLRHLHSAYGDAAPYAYGRRYIRLVIDDPTNADAYTSLGVLWAGPSFGLTRGWLRGRQHGVASLDVQNTTEYGAITGEVRPQPQVFAGAPERLPYSDVLLLADLREGVGLVRPWMFVEDVRNAGRLVAWTRYVVLASLPSFSAESGGSDTDRNALAESWTVDGFAIRESLP